MFKKLLSYKLYTENIWCCRKQLVVFSVSIIKDHGENALMIDVFGYRLWFGPNKPTFLNKR